MESNEVCVVLRAVAICWRCSGVCLFVFPNKPTVFSCMFVLLSPLQSTFVYVVEILCVCACVPCIFVPTLFFCEYFWIYVCAALMFGEPALLFELMDKCVCVCADCLIYSVCFQCFLVVTVTQYPPVLLWATIDSKVSFVLWWLLYKSTHRVFLRAAHCSLSCTRVVLVGHWTLYHAHVLL